MHRTAHSIHAETDTTLTNTPPLSIGERIILSGFAIFILATLSIAAINGILLATGKVLTGGPLEAIVDAFLTFADIL